MKNSILTKFYQGIVTIGSSLQSIFLLAIRLFFGGSFFMAGFNKLHNIQGIADFFAGLGLPFPLFNAYAASLIELICGACLFLGLGSRLASIGLMIVMAVAIYLTNYNELIGLFDDTQKLITQVPFIYFMASLLIFIFGPGKISVDELIERMTKKTY